MSDLYARLTKERNDESAFERLRKLCESKVVRWKFWEAPDWLLLPDKRFEIGKPPKIAPKEKALYRYGYDAQNRVVIIRDVLISKTEDDGAFYLLRHSGNTIAASRFRDKDLYAVYTAKLSDGRVVSLEQFGVEEWDSKVIQWKDDRVSKVTTSRGYERGNTVVIERIYGKRGKVLAEIDRSKRRKKKPLPKRVTLDSLDKELRIKLVQAVVKTVTRAKIKESAYCLALNYDCEGNPIMPPMLGIGLESEKRALLKKGGKSVKLDIWEPEQFSNFAKENTELDDKKLENAYDWYNQLLEKERTNAPAHKLLNEVAAILGKVDWRGKLKTTEDFIVYAVDTDGADLQKNLKLSVSPERLAKLKKAKLIP